MKFWISLTVLAFAIVGPSAESLHAQNPKPDTLTWVDTKLPPKELALLDRTIGFAPRDGVAGFKWLGDESRSFDAYRGRVVVLQSWSSTSEQGRTIVSRTVAALNDIPSNQYIIVAVHTPTNARNAERFAESLPSSVQLAVDEKGEWCDEMGIYRRPITILIDKQGAVRTAGVRAAVLTEAVRTLGAETYDPKAAPPAHVPPREHLRGTAARAEFPPKPRIEGANDLWGKKGPSLTVQSYVNGTPQTSGKVVIVEFWATWCSPCRKSIPHLNALATKFKSKALCIGISDEPVSKISDFMKETTMSYTVATDPGRTMANTVGHEGIPYAIVMSQDGIVRWQGSPFALSEQLLGEITAANDALGRGTTSEGPRWVTSPKR